MAFKFESLAAKRKVEPATLDLKKARVEDLSGKGYYVMYRYRPVTQRALTIDKFEDATLKRMKLLTKLYELDGRKAGDGFLEQARTIVEQPHFQFECSEQYDEDTLSHYALRLALCVSERWRQWFVKYELLLFKVRMSVMAAQRQQELLELNNIQVEEVGEKELKDIREQLRAVLDPDDRNQADEKYYKVPFQRVLKLVERRKVLLQKGKAFVPHRHVIQLLETTYRAHLMAELNKATKARVNLEPTERDRILAFLDHVLDNHDVEARQAGDALDLGAKLDRRQVHEVAQVHFPLCMRHLDEHLRDDHHLKFSGRWQYGLFIKGLGLSMEDALEFWKGEMTQSGKKVTAETWNKSRYAYNIRHYYGAEGKRTSYTAVSCTKIIMGPSPGPEQYHGCPFRHWNETQLRKELQRPRPLPGGSQDKQAAVFGPKVELTAPQVEETVKKAKDGFYTAACLQYFIHTHPGTYEESLFHNPIHYYASSRKYAEERTATEEGTAAAVASPSKQKTYVPLTPKAEPQSPKADGAAEAEPAPPAAGSP